VRATSASWHNCQPGLVELAVLAEVQELLYLPEMRLGQDRPDDIKRAVSLRFESAGWASDVVMSGSRLRVNYLRADLSAFVQLGNVSRTYADLLKLQTLQKRGRSVLGIEAVPTYDSARLMGSNHAAYERLCRELAFFADSIDARLLVLGLSG
jgi:hypothetical protein